MESAGCPEPPFVPLRQLASTADLAEHPLATLCIFSDDALAKAAIRRSSLSCLIIAKLSVLPSSKPTSGSLPSLPLLPLLFDDREE